MIDNTIEKIEEIIAQAEKMKNAYFWTPPQKACFRKSYEKYHSRDEVCWEESGHSYSAKYVVECTCKNIYAKGVYMKDGKKTTLTAIKNSLKRLKETNMEG